MHRSLVLLLLVIFGAGSVVSTHAQEKFGYVVELRGEWLLNGKIKLSQGSALEVNGVITFANPADRSGYIVIADRAGNIFQRRRCGSGECSLPIKLPTSISNDQSPTSSLIESTMTLVSSDPAKYDAPEGRGTRLGGFGDRDLGSRAGELQEAVVRLADGQIDLRDVFKNMQGDKYLLRFEPISKEKAGSAARLPFDWDPRKPVSLPANGLSPGLYRISISHVSLLESEGSAGASGHEAWILIADPDYYSKAAPSFLEAQNVTRKWGNSVKKSAIREFLRASLDFLTQSAH